MSIKELFKESRLLIILTLPLAISGLIEASIGFSSTAFLARLGHHALAAGALASWLFMTLMVVMWGVLTAVSVLIARYHGAQEQTAIIRVLRDSFLLALLLAIPALLLLWYGAPILLLLGQHKATVALAQFYLHSLMWGVPPDFVMLILLQFITGLGHTRVNLFFTVLWVPLNIFLNYILIFGKLGLPAFGIAGIGWGTSASYWLTTTLLLIYLLTNKKYWPYFQFKRARDLPSQLQELLRLGLPMGLMYCLEVAFFMTLSLLMGRINYQALAANQITLQYLWQVSVVSGCLAQAVTVRMGHNIGAKNIVHCKQIAAAGVYLALLFMLIVATIYWVFPEFIISIDLNTTLAGNQPVIYLAKQFLALCAVFQILESIRIVNFGALRSLKDTRFTLYTSIFIFWVVALGLGCLLAFHFNWQGQGLWLGLIISAACGAIILQARVHYKIKNYSNLEKIS